MKIKMMVISQFYFKAHSPKMKVKIFKLIMTCCMPPSNVISALYICVAWLQLYSDFDLKDQRSDQRSDVST